MGADGPGTSESASTSGRASSSSSSESTAGVAKASGTPETGLAAVSAELTGRFIHITDFHPDPHYLEGTSFDSGCHRVAEDEFDGADGQKKGKGKKGKGKKGDGDDEEEEVAGYWGSSVTDCDSPLSLVNMTFDWLKKEWADEVDFVIWTGDNARHDIDRSLPRTPREITALNEFMANKMLDAFGPEVVIVPSLGNNDIYPHNVMGPGPSGLTSGMLRVWKDFIPDDYDHVFERGAYFSAEVIPDQLAVVSLNTLYWYDSNTLVDGCEDGSSDPGALEFDWLEVQLEEFRERGMQVWLTGHVPPHSGNYYETCHLRYGDLALRYQDTIVGHLNIDHFFFLDVPELESRENRLLSTSYPSHRNLTLKGAYEGPSLHHGAEPHPQSGRMRTMGRNSNAALVDTLRKDFGDMPGPNKLKVKDYAVMNVAPSVIPTYMPAVRVYSYNITNITRYPDSVNLDSNLAALGRKHGHRHGRKKPKLHCKDPINRDKPHCRFKTRPRYYNKTSPSRSNVPLSALGYTQFYLPGVDGPKNVTPEWQIEYSTFKPDRLIAAEEGQPGPVPVHLLPQYDEGVFAALEASGEGERVRKFKQGLKRITPWRMKDLTIGSYVKLARKLVAEKKMWKQFSDFM
ncbi:Metallo-dependent phosphatase-like protein [Dioszegia hungarica]|uniref:Endopolyphosphatase n=1 Tax=Dioszegia hungarica TaxID=4972 RepID=A0AA38LSS2_9TREE|nr:Metallo-dependent phosphatase-like protein [Dioszegia hungarica]KAI9632969.1 Metallo-dependent phosphatase-like protein [Dioszegia hungarica]